MGKVLGVIVTMLAVVLLGLCNLIVPGLCLPNLVYILVDDLGWNDVPWHNTEVLMPNINTMAKSGLILDQSYSQPTCAPSRAALLTGYYPYRTGYQFIPPNNMEPNTPLRGRKGDTWEGGCRVPAFIANINQTGVFNGMFHFTDWLPTIYAGMLGGNVDDLGDIDGINQWEAIHNKKEPARSEILYDIANFQNTNFTYFVRQDWPGDFNLSGSFGAAIRVDNYKLLVGCSTIIGCARNYNDTWGGNTPQDRTLLFDLSNDPEEKIDLADTFADVVEDLKKRLDYHLSRAVKPIHVPIDAAGLPNNHFPPGQFFTGWCEAIEQPQPDQTFT